MTFDSKNDNEQKHFFPQVCSTIIEQSGMELFRLFLWNKIPLQYCPVKGQFQQVIKETLINTGEGGGTVLRETQIRPQTPIIQ